MGSFQQPIAKLIVFFIDYLNTVANLQQWRLQKTFPREQGFPATFDACQSLRVRKFVNNLF